MFDRVLEASKAFAFALAGLDISLLSGSECADLAEGLSKLEPALSDFWGQVLAQAAAAGEQLPKR